MTDITFIEYSPELDDSLLKLEASNVQGDLIRLKIHKDYFLQRAHVFPEKVIYIAGIEKSIVGSGIIAKVDLTINSEKMEAAFGFDVKVDQQYRGKGIGKWLSMQGLDLALKRFNTPKVFITMKVSNFAVQKIVQYHAKGNYMFPFVYLTIPSSQRLNKTKSGKPSQFKVTYTGADDMEGGLSRFYSPETGYFRTYHMYALSVEKIHPMIHIGYRLLQIIGPAKYKYLPTIGKQFKTCTAFGIEPTNIMIINDMLRDLQAEEVDFLMVCCRKGDEIYNSLKSISIDETRYLVGANFPIHENDTISMDVRCC